MFDSIANVDHILDFVILPQTNTNNFASSQNLDKLLAFPSSYANLTCVSGHFSAVEHDLTGVLSIGVSHVHPKNMLILVIRGFLLL